MSAVQLEEKYILEYVREMLISLKNGKEKIGGARYHHNTDYLKAPSVIRNGILSLNELNKRGIRQFPEKQLDILNDTNSHINGSNGISLSVVGLEDLYADEDEYNPLKSASVDILISNLVKASRTTNHYGNEFIALGIIEPTMFKSIDVRLLKYIESSKDKESVNRLIDKYNSLKLIACALSESKLDIPIREMSYEDDTNLDINSLVLLSELKVK